MENLHSCFSVFCCCSCLYKFNVALVGRFLSVKPVNQLPKQLGVTLGQLLAC